MPISENEELAKYRSFDSETLSLRIDMMRRAIATIVDRQAPEFGIPQSMKKSMRLLVGVARERGMLPRRR